ncbi:wall-associated receptor kinase-like 20 [Magnolia sinica]|uniref:wall-associated receptor kinase-like 20 n=1 Tax=Magnolia sinica TaxID=86752 RepID=UPI00265B40BD|nr:wall-associated receptor kinase-like 20 [Magnolia sinica]
MLSPLSLCACPSYHCNLFPSVFPFKHPNMPKTRNPVPPLSLFFLQLFFSISSSLNTCTPCGSLEVPYPLSTSPGCGDPNFRLRCNISEGNLYFDALNSSSYRVLAIQASAQHMVVQPSPWLPGSCVTQDMPKSEGLWLNQSLPFNVTASNTIFLFNCSPRILVSPLNCTPSSLCHRYLERSGRVDPHRVSQCTSGLSPCCTFVAGGMPSAYKIRLHNSGCRAFRSILHIDLEKPASEWEEGLEIQWASPPEPVCQTQLDCSRTSTCSTTKLGLRRCLCNRGYHWDHAMGICSRDDPHRSLSPMARLGLEAAMGALALFMILMAAAAITVRKSRKFSGTAGLAKVREDMLKASTGGKSAPMFRLKELKKATDGFSKERMLGSGGFGEVYKGVLEDGSLVAVKSAKVGNIKSNQQVLNEVGILSQVNHKNLVRLLGCCVEADPPLLVYEYISNGTLHNHLRRSVVPTFLGWKMRLNIALQTAEALAYLHSSAHTPIYHRDVKSTNILLDDELNAKVADFGLSRLARPGLSHVSTCAQGTLGYLDPEYYRNYQLTDKSDVYSYGVVLLELLTSQRAIDFSRHPDDVNLAVFVTQRAREGRVMDVVDRRLLTDEPLVVVVRSVELFAELALACLREKKGERPSMKEVVQELQYIIETVAHGEVAGKEGGGLISVM